MKLHRILVLSAACLAAQAAVSIDTGPDPKVLATTDAILTYCGKLDPSSAEKYLGQVQQITGGASDDAIAGARRSEEYRHAREELEAALQGVDEKEALKACAPHTGPSG